MNAQIKHIKTLFTAVFLTTCLAGLFAQADAAIDYAKLAGAWSPAQIATLDDPDSFDFSFEDYDVFFEIDEDTGKGKMIEKRFDELFRAHPVRMFTQDDKNYIEIEWEERTSVCEILKMDGAVLLVKSDANRAIWKWEKKE